MEEWVGSIWHKFIMRKSSSDFSQARVELRDVSKSAGLIFRALGGDPAKRLEAAAPRDYLIRRSLLQRISGSHLQFSLAWQDETSLRLPESIAIFPTKSLNQDLYIWLAALAAYTPTKFTHWAKDNQARVLLILNKYPSLAIRYQALVTASLALRPAISSLPKTHQALEYSIVCALKNPGSVSEFPMANHAPHVVYLWIYPNQKSELLSQLRENNDVSEPEDENAVNKLTSRKARKKSERTEQAETKDSLMVFRLENLFSWSEFSKVNRAEDDSEDNDAKRVAEDLDMLTLGQLNNQKTAKLRIDLDLPSAIEDDLPLGDGIHLPEWDYKSQRLVAKRCLLQPMLPRDSAPQKLPMPLVPIAKKIRAQFENQQSLKQWQTGQQQGDEIDLSAWLDFRIESQTSIAEERGLFRSYNHQLRDISCLLLADISMSTGAFIDNNSKVIDVIKNSLLLFGEALEAAGDDFAMYGFSSVKRHHVRFSLLKNFAEKYSDIIRGRVLQLRPGFYTRMGAAIRQASNIMAMQQSSKKLLLILTDGKPNDIDHYEGRFGVEDTHQAILAAKRLGIIPFCITIDQEADEYLPYIFGSDGFTVILNASQLPTRLPQLYHQLTGNG